MRLNLFPHLFLLFAITLLAVPEAAAQRSSACYGNDTSTGCLGRFKGMISDSNYHPFNTEASDVAPYEATCANPDSCNINPDAHPPIGISKVNIHTFFKFGTQTPVFVHFMPWFTICNQGAGEYPEGGPTTTDPSADYVSCNGHVEVGYVSNNLTRVATQVSDIRSRGFDGLIVDWNGPTDPAGKFENATTMKVRDEVEGRYSTASQRPLFGLMEDQGSFKRPYPSTPSDPDPPGNCSTITDPAAQQTCITQHLTRDFDYMRDNYLGKLSYVKTANTNANQIDQANGLRPTSMFFVDDGGGSTTWLLSSMQWATVYNDLRTHTSPFPRPPRYVFRNGPGFAHTQSDGAYAWVAPGEDGTTTRTFSVLDDFYSAARSNSSKQQWGAGYKGFDERKSGFTGQARTQFVSQSCGLVWLNAMRKANTDYMDLKNTPLPFLQLVTWNDYDEGTEIESGIDNCVSKVTASNDGTTLSWTAHWFAINSSIYGTIHHFELRDSSTGQFLANLSSANCVVSTVDAECSQSISSLGLPPGAFDARVWAVGWPSMKSLGSNGYTSIFIPDPDPDPSPDPCFDGSSRTICLPGQ